MTKIKAWIICYVPQEGKEPEAAWETKEEAVRCLADSIAEGRELQDVKFQGRSVLAARVFTLLREAKIVLAKAEGK